MKEFIKDDESCSCSRKIHVSGYTMRCPTRKRQTARRSQRSERIFSQGKLHSFPSHLEALGKDPCHQHASVKLFLASEAPPVRRVPLETSTLSWGGNNHAPSPLISNIAKASFRSAISSSVKTRSAIV
jgi:hypothetical protein